MRSDGDWWRLKDQAKSRGLHRCEFCRRRGIADLHHRRYPSFGRETLVDVMAVCDRCHHAIHHGGDLVVNPGSLAARGDQGRGLTPPWFAYLKAPPRSDDPGEWDRRSERTFLRDRWRLRVRPILDELEAKADEKYRDYPMLRGCTIVEWELDDTAHSFEQFEAEHGTEVLLAAGLVVRVSITAWVV